MALKYLTIYTGTVIAAKPAPTNNIYRIVHATN